VLISLVNSNRHIDRGFEFSSDAYVEGNILDTSLMILLCNKFDLSLRPKVKRITYKQLFFSNDKLFLISITFSNFQFYYSFKETNNQNEQVR